MSYTESQVPLPDEVGGLTPEPDGLTPEPEGQPTEVELESPTANPYGSAGDPIHPDDPDDEWSTGRTSRGIRVGAVTGVLLILVAVVGGFWGGAAVEKNHASGSTSTGSAASRLAAAARAAAAGGSGASLFGRGGFGGGSGSATTGTVIGVSGNVLDVSNSAGNIVKVTVGPTATVTRTSNTPLTGLKVGDTVVVTGTTGSGGAVSATAVRASAAGVTTPGAGGFTGGSGFGGG